MPLEEVQEGLRWVRSEGDVYEEQISMRECSGYDNNIGPNLHAALDRGLVKYYEGHTFRDRVATHVLDGKKLPPFDPEHRFRIVLEFLPAKGKKAAVKAVEVALPPDTPMGGHQEIEFPEAPTKSQVARANNETLRSWMELYDIPIPENATNRQLQDLILAKLGD